ncbi:low-complexity tail membrane protein [Pleurocapsales cyanobacterium LEGE 10410]|nr:low-complexity tail membrane protein [Pleurocapsales cyanobacterium LEGE 10410]
MSTLRSEPFLWIHLAGIALFPALLGVTWIGLAIGDSLPYFLELPLLSAIAILPILLMQLTRPFDIFSILLFSLKPGCLTEEQRKILSLFKTNKQKLISAIAAIAMTFILWLLYRLSPLAIGLAHFLPQWRILGLAISVTAFLASNLFLQVPLSVLVIFLTQKSEFTQIEPHPLEQIEQNFTIPGIKVSKILWFLRSPSKAEEIS